MNTTLLWLPAPLPASIAKQDVQAEFQMIEQLHKHHPPLVSCSATSLNCKTTSSSKILND
jgi:hypothetical protein